MIINKRFPVLIVLSFIVISLKSQNVQSINVVKEDGFYCAIDVVFNNIPYEGKFIIDTGADVSILDESILNQLSIPYKYKKSKLSDGKIAKELNVAEIKVDFAINDIKIKNQSFKIIRDFDFSFLNICNIKGIIGRDIIGKYIWSFTNEHVSIIKNIKEVPDIDDYTKSEIFYKNPPFVNIEFGRPLAYTIFDTGYNGFLEVNNRFLNLITIKDSLKGKGITAQRMLSLDTTSFAIKVDTFAIANIPLTNAIADVGDEQVWVVGAELFDYYDVIMDFRKKSMYVRQTKTEYKSEDWRNFGFKFSVEEGSAYVSYIWDNSSAVENDVQLNDRIIKINKLNIKELNASDCEIYSIIQEELNQDTITIELEDDNKTLKKVNLNKKCLL